MSKSLVRRREGVAVAKSQKKFSLRADQIKPLAPNRGGCIATDMITVEGCKVGYMYREEPDNDGDSGWRFMSGRESQAYMDGAVNHAVYDVETIANYDPEAHAGEARGSVAGAAPGGTPGGPVRGASPPALGRARCRS